MAGRAVQFGHDRTGSDGGIPLEVLAAVAHQQRDPDIQNAKVPLQGAFIPSAEYALLPMSGTYRQLTNSRLTWRRDWST
jgi:hypothetical protein